MREVVEFECPNLHALEYTSNLLPFHSLSLLNPKHFKLEFHLLAFQHAIWLETLLMLFENNFSTTKYPKVFIVLKDHKVNNNFLWCLLVSWLLLANLYCCTSNSSMQEVIILDMDEGLIEIMFSILCRLEDLKSTSKIIIASSFATLNNETLIPTPPYMAFSMVSSFTSNFSQVFEISTCCFMLPLTCSYWIDYIYYWTITNKFGKTN